MIDRKRFRVLTFDCYGTLIDWEGGILAGLRPILEAHGLTRDDETVLELHAELEAATEAGPYQPYRAVLGQVLRQMGERLQFQPTPTEIEGFSASVIDWPVFDDTVAALERLAARYRLVVVSNIDRDLFEASRRKLGSTIADVVTAQDVGAYKPDRRVFEHAIEAVGVPREKVLHVAQSLFHDIQPARELGLTTVWVNRRHDRPGFGATPPAEAVPDFEVPNLAALADQLC